MSASPKTSQAPSTKPDSPSSPTPPVSETVNKKINVQAALDRVHAAAAELRRKREAASVQEAKRNRRNAVAKVLESDGEDDQAMESEVADGSSGEALNLAAMTLSNNAPTSVGDEEEWKKRLTRSDERIKELLARRAEGRQPLPFTVYPAQKIRITYGDLFAAWVDSQWLAVQDIESAEDRLLVSDPAALFKRVNIGARIDYAINDVREAVYRVLAHQITTDEFNWIEEMLFYHEETGFRSSAARIATSIRVKRAENFFKGAYAGRANEDFMGGDSEAYNKFAQEINDFLARQIPANDQVWDVAMLLCLAKHAMTEAEILQPTQLAHISRARHQEVTVRLALLLACEQNRNLQIARNLLANILARPDMLTNPIPIGNQEAVDIVLRRVMNRLKRDDRADRDMLIAAKSAMNSNVKPYSVSEAPEIVPLPATVRNEDLVRTKCYQVSRGPPAKYLSIRNIKGTNKTTGKDYNFEAVVLHHNYMDDGVQNERTETVGNASCLIPLIEAAHKLLGYANYKFQEPQEGCDVVG